MRKGTAAVDGTANNAARITSAFTASMMTVT
jgi:hypothetical protein